MFPFLGGSIWWFESWRWVTLRAFRKLAPFMLHIGCVLALFNHAWAYEVTTVPVSEATLFPPGAFCVDYDNHLTEIWMIVACIFWAWRCFLICVFGASRVLGWLDLTWQILSDGLFDEISILWCFCATIDEFVLVRILLTVKLIIKALSMDAYQMLPCTCSGCFNFYKCMSELMESTYI